MEDKYAAFLAALAGLAGSPTPSTRDEALLKEIVDRLDSIATAASTAELPAVTSDDNGDVLTVVDGAWGKAAPSGGTTFVELTISNDDNSITSTVKAGALWEAVTTGHVVFVTKADGVIDAVYTLVEATATIPYVFEVYLYRDTTVLLSAPTADDYPTATLT